MKKRFITLLGTLTGVLTIFSTVLSQANGMSPNALVKHLMTHYNKDVRPSQNGEPTKVDLDIAVIKILLVEERNEALTTNLWLRMYWKDERLTWNVTEFNNINVVTLNAEKAWVPHIDLLNSVEGSDKISSARARVQASSDGRVWWLIPIIIRSSCSIDITYFPFDDQVCPITFGSWSNNKNELEIVPKNPTADTKMYKKNGEWTLLGVKSKEETRKKFHKDYEYAIVSYSISIRRETLFYMMNFIVPCVLIAFLTVPVLLLPPESQERQSYGVTVLLSFTILIMMLQEKIPATSKAIPMIAVYYACTILQVSLAMGMSTVMLCFYYKRPCTTPVPKWVKVGILNWCAKLVRLHDSVDKIKQKLYANTWKQFTIRKTHSISGNIKHVTESIFNKQEESIRQEEWRIAAYIVNRFFAWLYLFTIIITVFIVFFKAPRTQDGNL